MNERDNEEKGLQERRRIEVTITGKRRGGQEILIPLQSRRN